MPGISSGLVARPRFSHHYKILAATEKGSKNWQRLGNEAQPAEIGRRRARLDQGEAKNRPWLGWEGIVHRRRGHVVVVELGGAGGAVPGAGLGRLLRLV